MSESEFLTFCPFKHLMVELRVKRLFDKSFKIFPSHPFLFVLLWSCWIQADVTLRALRCVTWSGVSCSPACVRAGGVVTWENTNIQSPEDQNRRPDFSHLHSELLRKQQKRWKENLFEFTDIVFYEFVNPNRTYFIYRWVLDRKQKPDDPKSLISGRVWDASDSHSSC